MKDGVVKYFFLRDKRNFPVTCIASVFDEKDAIVKFAIATYNPDRDKTTGKIDKFDKKEAAKIASGRIAKGRFCRVFASPADIKNIKWNILSLLYQNKLSLDYSPLKKDDWRKNIPTRTKEAAFQWLKIRQEKEEKAREAEAAAANAPETIEEKKIA